MASIVQHKGKKKSPPRPLLCCVGKQGASFYYGPSAKKMGEPTHPRVFDSVPFDEMQAKQSAFSDDGRICAVLQQNAIQLLTFQDNVDEANLNESSVVVLGSMACEGVLQVALSPCGSFIVTQTRFVKGMEQPNLVVWSIDQETGATEVAFQATNRNQDNWPAVKWSQDESIACHMVTNEVRIYNGRDFAAGFHSKLRVPGLAAYEFVKAANTEGVYRFAVFKQESKGKPAQVSVYSYPDGLERPSASKSMFKAQHASLLWNSLGTVVLANTETLTDSTGQSYYGESLLHLLHADGQYDCIVQPTKEGNVQDVKWNPNGKNFILVAGKMPSHSTLYNLKGDPIFEFGQAHRNTIRFSPTGRFVCIGGFGNLVGDMDFWDVSKRELLASLNATNAVAYEWSADGRTFLTATLHPRMRVDNGFSLYTYRGELLHKFAWPDELYTVAWRKALPFVYPDRPQSPLPEGAKRVVQKQQIQAPKKQAYRPPNSTGRLSEMMRNERDGVKAGKVGKEEPKGPSKNAIRKQRRAAAKEAAEQKAKLDALAPKEDAAQDPAKLLRKNNKLLKQILELEFKQNNGEELSEEQLAKLGKKGAVEAKIKELQESM